MTKERIHTVLPILLQTPIYIFTWGLFKVFGRLSVKGKEHIPTYGRKTIFAANHTSDWDGILIRVGLPYFSRFSPMYYVAMAAHEYADSSLRGFFYGGNLFRWVGAYPRYSGKKDYEYSLKNFVTILEEGRSVCIFPEGQRNFDGQASPAHGGVAFLSHRTQTPVVPVHITGLENMSLFRFIFFKQHVTVTFGPVLTPVQVVAATKPTVEEYKKGGDIVMKLVGKL